MKLKVEDFCIRCGICLSLYPALFELDEEGDIINVLVDEVPESLMDDAKDAIKDCAVTAIRFTK